MSEAESSNSGVKEPCDTEVAVLRRAVTCAEADKRRAESRLEAYQATCHKQGVKLGSIEALLMAESDQANGGQDVHLLSTHQLSFKDATLQAIADILKEKGSNR